MKSIPSDKKFKSRKDWEGYVWKKLVSGFYETNSVEDIGRALDILLTENEKRQIINRASAISLLKQGMSYREIGRVLWLSSGTISAVRKSIREQGGYISDYSRNKRSVISKSALTKREFENLKFDAWLESLFTIANPPLKHPRLMRALGLKNKY